MKNQLAALACAMLPSVAFASTGTFLTTFLSVDSYDTPGLAFGIDVEDGLAVVCDHLNGLQFLDVSDPTDIQFLGSLATPTAARQCEIFGEHVALAARDGGLFIVDSTMRQIVGSIDTPGLALSVDVRGNLAAVADKNEGLRLYSVADPTNPTFLGALDTAGFANDVHLVGGLAYVADFDNGLLIIDVADPTNPILLGSYDTAGTANAVTTLGPYAYVADGLSGMDVLDVSDPENPLYIRTRGSPGNALELVSCGVDRLLLADGPSGLRVYDASDPTAPVLAEKLATLGTAYHVGEMGGHALLAVESAGVESIQFAELTVTNAPSTNARLALRALGGTGALLDLPRTTPLTATIYDLRGRALRTLRRGTLPAGQHVLEWNGRDDTGRSVARGRYFLRVTTPEASASLALLLFR